MALYLGSDSQSSTYFGSVKHIVTSKTSVRSLYSLKCPKTFKNEYVDTGLKLGEYDMDYTICIDIGSSTPSNTSTIFGYMYEVSPWPGLVVRYSGTTGINGLVGSTTVFSANAKHFGKFVVTRDVYNKTYNTYWLEGDQLRSSSKVMEFAPSIQSLVIGCSMKPNGEGQRYFDGTLNFFNVYSKLFSSDRIETFLKKGVIV